MDDVPSTTLASANDTGKNVRTRRLGRGLQDLLSSAAVEVKANEFAVALDAAPRDTDATDFVTTKATTPETTVEMTDIQPSPAVASTLITEQESAAAATPTPANHDATGEALAAPSIDLSEDASDFAAEPTPEEDLAAIAGNLEAAVRLLAEHRDTPMLLLQRSLRAAWCAAGVAALLVVGVVWWAAATTSVQRQEITQLQSDLTNARAAQTNPATSVAIANAGGPTSASKQSPPAADQVAKLTRVEQELELTRTALSRANAAIDELMSNRPKN